MSGPYYITKYALTEGILKVQGEISGDLLSWRRPGAHRDEYAHGDGKNWHRTEEGARKKAEEMRKRRVGALLKGAAKLEAMTILVRDKT